jgi:hypothetical protein
MSKAMAMFFPHVAQKKTPAKAEPISGMERINVQLRGTKRKRNSAIVAKVRPKNGI